jgi:xanthine dehydrogenase accessory factor
MRDVISEIDRWRALGKPVALATVIQTWGSGPRRAGARMALTAEGGIAGSVSGGCVESAVVQAGREILRSGRPELLRFGVADETAWSVGLACGGTIEVFVQRLDPAHYDRLRAALQEERPLANLTVVVGPGDLPGRELLVTEEGSVFGEIGSGLDPLAADLARTALARGRPERRPLEDGGTAGPVEVFIDVLPPSPQLVVVGGVHIAIALTALARTLGYRTVIIDPRQAFGNPERFPHADKLIQEWPEDAFAQVALTRSTAVATLTHDPKIDDPSLAIALASPAFYVGALGSRKTQERRRKRLRDQGVSDTELDRLRAPIGLNLGAETPEEIALAVMAEILAARREKLQAPGL